MRRRIAQTSLIAGCLLGFSLSLASTAQAQVVFMAPQETLTFGSSTPEQYRLSILIRDDSAVPLVTQGFSMGMSHDPEVAEALDIDYGESMLDDSWGEPTFFGTNTYSNGWTCGVVYSFLGTWTYSFPTPEEAVIVTYAPREDAAFLTDQTEMTTPLTWTDSLGSPPTSNNIVSSGASVIPELEDGYLTFTPRPFVRGDMNGDGTIDLADVFTAQDYAILGGPAPDCLAALDSNADGGIDIADLVYLLSYLFVDGEPPAGPFESCGPETIATEIRCQSYSCP